MVTDTKIGHSRGAVHVLRGSTTVPADKSISQRAAILGALAKGTTHIGNYSACADAASTLSAVGNLGAVVEGHDADVSVTGIGDLSSISGTVDMGKSGTGMRLLTGALSAQGCSVTLAGHPQLLARPMSRLAFPLREMGADIELADGEHAPITIRPSTLHGIRYELPVASAQIKSALLLAGLGAEGPTTVVESRITRDHTERLLRAMGASVEVSGDGPRQICVEPAELEPLHLTVPGDLSSALFIIAAATLVPGSEVVITQVGLNPTRSRALAVLQTMGADIEIAPTQASTVEPAADLRVRHAPLHGIALSPEDVPMLIDELPVISLLATQADGETTFGEASELRVKESDRLAGIAAGLRGLGAEIVEHADGLSINGHTPLHGGHCDSLGDHRLAMTFTIAGLCTSETVTVDGMASIDDSFPGFVGTLRALGADL